MSNQQHLNGHAIALRATGGFGAVLGYGSLLAFLWLVGMQVYHWFRDGEWTHIGGADALRHALNYCCSNAAPGGHLAALGQWLDDPASWLGFHKVLEVVPASLILFLLSILGNCLFIYCRDRELPDSAAVRLSGPTADDGATAR